MIVEFFAAAYSIAALVSCVILSKWLHAHRREELGNSLIIEVMMGIVFACFWPVTIPLMLENN